MTDDHTYRRLPRYANSDLSELAARLNPTKHMKASAETLAFGSHFHQMVLEPGTATTEQTARFTADKYGHLCSMYLAFRREPGLTDLIDFRCQCEVVRTWICPQTGLPLKAKIDAIVEPRRVHLIDLKTTACKTKSAFIDSLMQYDYDRQAAFYLSSDPAARFFEFVGVQKQAPYSVFRVPYHVSSPFIVGGQRKMNYLLSLARADGWRPSSWSRNAVD